MANTIIQLTGTGTANQKSSGVAAVDIPEDGSIVLVDWSIFAPSAAAGFSRAQLSFISTHQFDTNDARGVISEIVQQSKVHNTSGASSQGANKSVSFMEPLEVSGGERIFVHTDSTAAGLTVGFTCLAHLKVRTTVRRSRRRR